MTFRIEHFSSCGDHITLHPDGTIELYQHKSLKEMLENQNEPPIRIEYQQAKILKAMIIAEHELAKQ